MLTDTQAITDVASSLETTAKRLEAEWLKLPVFDPSCDAAEYEKQRKTRRFLMDIYAKQVGESMARLLENKCLTSWPIGEVVDRHSPGCGRDKQSSLSFFRALAMHVGYENVAPDGLTSGGYHHADVMRALAGELRTIAAGPLLRFESITEPAPDPTVEHITATESWFVAAGGKADSPVPSHKKRTREPALDAFYDWWGDRTGLKQWQAFVDWSKDQPATDGKSRNLWVQVDRPTRKTLSGSDQAYRRRQSAK